MFMIYRIASIAPICAQLHTEGKRVVLATGFFDLLHQEHINFLVKAKAAGDTLIVAVESDERARALKGEGRPVETQNVRCTHLLPYVDFCVALPPDFDHFEAYDSLMYAVKPNIYAVSSHTDHLKSKTFLVEKYGGKLIVVHEHNPAISTTQLINAQ
jgi:cytidyltransferase-like protein